MLQLLTAFPSEFVVRCLNAPRLWLKKPKKNRCSSWLRMSSGTFALNGSALVAVVEMAAGAFDT